MKHGSLFSGIGGFDLAADRIGWKNQFHCEKDEFCRKILKRHWQNTISYEDITTTDFSIWNGRIDVLSGGFPCQDISPANFNAQGITGIRSGLWSEFDRAIGEINPNWIVIENSPNLLKKGFEKVLFDLSNRGYNAEWECISASAFSFPHERKRLFIVAYSNGIRQPGSRNIFEDIRNHTAGREWQTNRVIDAIQRKTLPPLCDSNNGFPDRMVKNGIKTLGNAALHALGNAVIPQIPEQIFKVIDKQVNNKSQYENNNVIA